MTVSRTVSRILVTGASGFVGRTLVVALRARGHVVRRVLRSTVKGGDSGEPEDVVVIGDIHGETDWGCALDGVDTVIHLAARVHMFRDKASDPLAAFRRVNTEGTLTLARAACAAGVRRFVFLSTVGVLRPPCDGGPLSEASPIEPNGAYARSKLEAELGLSTLAELLGLEIVIVRAPLVYGPGAPGHLARLGRMLMLQFPIPVPSLVNRRSLIGVQSLAECLAICAEHPAAAGETFLVADAETVTTEEIMHYLACGLEVPFRRLVLPAWFLRCGATFVGYRSIYNKMYGNLWVKSTKASELLGWVPRLLAETREGLVATGASYRG